MSEFLNQVFTTFRSQDYLEYSGLVFGLFYVILAAQNKPLCWVFGIISCLAIAIKDFTDYKLYSDGILQLFYIVMGFFGLYIWRLGGDIKDEKSISKWTFKKHIPYAGGVLFATLCLSFVFKTYTDASFPHLDALTTSLSVYATYLLVFRVWDNWIFWIIANILYIFLYWSQEAYFFSVLMALYTIIAVYGLIKWRNELSLLHRN